MGSRFEFLSGGRSGVDADRGGATVRADGFLVLHYDRLSERVQSFFDQLEGSASFREVFLRDPAGTMSEALLDGQASGAEVNQANRLLFALLGNRGFMEWAASYQQRLLEQSAGDGGNAEQFKLAAATVDRSRIYGDLVKAIVDHVDLETMYSMVVSGDTRASIARAPAPSPEVAVYTETFIAGYVVALFFLVVTQIDVTPAAPTESLTRLDLERVSGFVAERLAAQAQELRETGALTDYDRAVAGGGTSWDLAGQSPSAP